MKTTLYTFSIMAVKDAPGNVLIEHYALVLQSENQDLAKIHALADCLLRFPVDEGWYAHSASPAATVTVEGGAEVKVRAT